MMLRGQLQVFIEIVSLYFLQGIPYGFQVKYLPLMMRKEGHELSRISAINLVSLPWILKCTWACLFDRFEESARIWITGCLASLAFFSLLFNYISSIWSFTVLTFFMISFFSASLDIAVDALAIKRFEAKDLGYCNVGHVVGYKVGILFGGGLLTVLSQHIKLEHFNLIQTLIYGIAALYFLTTDSRLFTKNCSQIIEKPKIQHKHALSKWMSLKILLTPQQIWLLIFVFFYKVGEQGFSSMYPLHLIDDGHDMSQIGLVTGIIGQICSISGSSLGGILISKYRIEVRHLLFVVAFWRSFTLIVYSYFILTITSNFLLHAFTESIFQLLAGTMTTATFTAMMMTSKALPETVHALHFTIIATFEVLGKLLMKLSAGMITEHVGYSFFFLICCVIDFFVVLLALVNFKPDFSIKPQIAIIKKQK